jgi:hypothetical protein
MMDAVCWLIGWFAIKNIMDYFMFDAECLKTCTYSKQDMPPVSDICDDMIIV